MGRRAPRLGEGRCWATEVKDIQARSTFMHSFTRSVFMGCSYVQVSA